MKKVIDANYFQNLALEDYLKSEKSNMVVFPDYACMEAYKGNAIKNISKSIEIVSRFPDQIIVLKGTRDVINLTLAYDGLRKLEDPEQTRQFRVFCLGVQCATLGDVALTAQILEKGRMASAHFDRLQKDTAIVANGMEELAKSFSAEHLRVLKKKHLVGVEVSEKIIRDIFLLAALIYQKHPGIEELPEIGQVRNSYIFRFALSAYLLALRWISDGGPGKVRLDRLRNDLVDMNYVAYATFFDGLLTKDKKMEEIYKDACLILQNVFNHASQQIRGNYGEAL